jgi:hypothetical protein
METNTQTSNRTISVSDIGSAVALKKSTVAADIEKITSRTTVKKQEAPKEDTRFKEIEANPFFKIQFNESLDEEQKANEIAKNLSAETLKDLLTFDEWLASTREKMATDLIRLNDPEAMSELQMTYNQMGDDLRKFEDQARPFTEVLDAIYTLRTNGKTLDVLTQIKDRQKQEDALNAEFADSEKRVTALQEEATRLVTKNATLAQEKSLPFGFGGVKQSARQQIAANDVRLQQIATELEQEQAKLTSINEKKAELVNAAGEFVDEAEKLRKFLNLSSEEHQNQAKELKNAATSFIDTSKARVGSVRKHITSREEQIARFKKANNNMQLVYAVMEAGVAKCFEQNIDKSKNLAASSPGENLLAKSKREQTKEQVDQFVKKLEVVKTDTLNAYSGLSTQGVRVNNMKDANDQQSEMVRNLHTQGIAEVADNLSVLMEGIAGAALGEASAMAKEVLIGMNNRTNAMSQKEVVKQAMNGQELVKDVQRSIENMAQYAETLTATQDIRRSTLAELRDLTARQQAEAKKLIETTQEVTSLNTNLETEQKATETPKEEPKTDPFGLNK